MAIRLTGRQWFVYIGMALALCTACYATTLAPQPIKALGTLGFPIYLYGSAYWFRWCLLRNKGFQPIEEMLGMERTNLSVLIHSPWLPQGFSLRLTQKENEFHFHVVPTFSSHTITENMKERIRKTCEMYTQSHPRYRLISLVSEKTVHITYDSKQKDH